MYFPLLLVASINLLDILSTDLLKVSFWISTPCGFHSLFKFNHIFYRWLLLFVNFSSWNSPQVSIGFRRGLDASHGNNSIAKSWNHGFLTAAARIATLSCWKAGFLSSISFTKDDNSPCNGDDQELISYSVRFIPYKSNFAYPNMISDFLEISNKIIWWTV